MSNGSRFEVVSYAKGAEAESYVMVISATMESPFLSMLVLRCKHRIQALGFMSFPVPITEASSSIYLY